MPRNNTYLNICDGGTSTPNLYLLYLSAKVTWIAKLRRQYEKVISNNCYMAPTWVCTLLEIFKVHNIEIRHLNMICRGDIEYIALILCTYKLYFWSSVFLEYSYYLELIDQDCIEYASINKKISKINGCRNHRFIGSLKDENIVKRNKKIKINSTTQDILKIDNSNLLSIMNPITSYLLNTGRFCLGNILSQDMELIKVSSVLTHLTNSQYDKKKLETFLHSKMPFSEKFLKIGSLEKVSLIRQQIF